MDKIILTNDGKVPLYRGMALNRMELADIEANGIVSSAVKSIGAEEVERRLQDILDFGKVDIKLDLKGLGFRQFPELARTEIDVNGTKQYVAPWLTQNHMMAANYGYEDSTKRQDKDVYVFRFDFDPREIVHMGSPVKLQHRVIQNMGSYQFLDTKIPARYITKKANIGPVKDGNLNISDSVVRKLLDVNYSGNKRKKEYLEV